MRIIILTQYYPPETGAPQRRLAQLAEGLVERGHQVIVLTAMPNYPSGKVLDGYGGLAREEQRNRVRVIRTFIAPTQSAGLVSRLLSYISFMLSSLLVGAVKLAPADYLLTESPPLFLGLTGLLLSRLKGARWIFNVSDLWPESAVRIGVLGPGRMLQASQLLEQFCYNHAWLVSGQSHSILENIRSRFPHVRTILFSNGVNTAQFSPAYRQPGRFGDGKRAVALYAGLHGLAQGLDQLLDAAKQLGQDSPIDMVLMGDGPTKRALVARAEREHLSHVHFLDSVPSDDMPTEVASADIALVVLKNYIPGAVPSKLYEAMAAGVPVLLVAGGESAEIVRRHDAGCVVEPNDIAGLANALRTLGSDPLLRKRLGANGRRAAEQFFDRRVMVRKFVDFLEMEAVTREPSSVISHG